MAVSSSLVGRTWSKIVFGLFVVPALAACGAKTDDRPKPAYLSVDGVEMRVYYEPDIFHVEPITVVGDDGRLSTIDPFPLTSGMVVARRDGQSLADEDEPKAREAAEYYCAKLGGQMGWSDRARLASEDSQADVLFFKWCEK